MSEGFEALTEKEKQTLRLMGRGHDAKSSARHLGVSVHTVNERLRLARRKMSVTSSREAARILLDREEAVPKSFVDEPLREAGHAGPIAEGELSKDGGRPGRSTSIIAGAVIMSLLVAAFMLSTMPPQSPGEARVEPGAVAPAPDPAVVDAARDFLVLVDNGRWAESWNATGSAFRKLNTVARWTSASEQARVPLGAALSRDFLSYDYVPAPPRGYAIVKFRTRFANNPTAIETVSLDREGSAWRVVGIVID